MSNCCDKLDFTWVEDDGEQVLFCAGCGSRWEPNKSEIEETVSYRDAWEQLRERVESKTSLGKNALKDLMLDCLVGASGRDG